MSGSGESDGMAWVGSAVVMAVVLQKYVGPSGAAGAPGHLGEERRSGAVRAVGEPRASHVTAGGADNVTKVDMPTTNESLLRVGHVHHPAHLLGKPSTFP
ncbi:hypothetical protein GCM10010303_64650 [Streptomyces purpurascens]|nr:hypothetical protein GCM10010303_64650 [Streptomyces purpurascens]